MMAEHNRRAGDRGVLPYEFEGRLARLETDMEAIKSALGNVASSLDKMSSDFTTQITRQSRTPWAVLASWAGIILTIVALIGSSYVRDLVRIELDQDTKKAELQGEMRLLDDVTQIVVENHGRRIETLEGRVWEHQSDGHPEVGREHDDAIEKRLERVEQYLQRRLEAGINPK